MAREYDHLFKLLIIGDSGKCTSIRVSHFPVCWGCVLYKKVSVTDNVTDLSMAKYMVVHSGVNRVNIVH